MKRQINAVIFILLFFSSSLTAFQYELAICGIFQNEARFLKEWIEFHRLQGVQHFYLINNLSNDNYFEVLQPYINYGIVELSHCNENNPAQWNVIQVCAYNALLSKFQRECKWVAVLDVDEFLFPVEKSNLIEFLKEYEREDIAALYVFWQCYGSTNVYQVPANKLMTNLLIMKAHEQYWLNKWGKSIIRPQKVSGISIHVPNVLPGCFQVTEDKQPYFHGGTFEQPLSYTVSVSKVRINHYWTRDEKFFYEVKLPRYQKWGTPRQDAMGRYLEMNKVQDPIIRRFTPQMNLLMGFQ